MNIKQILQNDLEFNENLAAKLEPYANRKTSELPDNIKAELQKIRTGPKLTTSGLEPVKTLLVDLYLVNESLKEAIKDPDKFMKLYEKKSIQTTPALNNKAKPPPWQTKNPPVVEKQSRKPVLISLSKQPTPSTSLGQATVNKQSSTLQPSLTQNVNKIPENVKIKIRPEAINPKPQPNNETPPQASKIEL